MRPYKGYTGTIEFDEDGLVFHGRLIGIRDTVTYEADSALELVKAFHDSVDDYLDFCAEKGREPQKPFSGNISLRMDPELHRRVAEMAANHAKSVNQWISDTLADAAREGANSGTTRVRG